MDENSWSFSRLPDRPGWEPGSIPIGVTQTSKDGRSDSGILIYQRRGNLLSGIYAFGIPGPSVQLATRYARLLANELNHAPSRRMAP